MTGRRVSVALVTGASRGIGAAIARRLAADGMIVAINSYPDKRMITLAEDVAREIHLSGGRAAVYAADISNGASVDAMFADCEDELGTVEVLVLNAAATGRVRWTDIRESDWDRVSAVNLKGAFLCSRRAFGLVRSPNDGAVITIGSILAHVGAPRSLHYATTKAGIIGFTRSLAREVAPRGTRVNCVIPGAILTEEEREAFPDRDAADSGALKMQMLQRRGHPEDVAGAVSFLASSDSSFMTGQTVSVDGGWGPL